MHVEVFVFMRHQIGLFAWQKVAVGGIQPLHRYQLSRVFKLFVNNFPKRFVQRDDKSSWLVLVHGDFDADLLKQY